MYKIKSITPKYQKSDNQLLGYNVKIVNEAETYNITEFYSVSDMKSTFKVDTVEGSKLLVGKSVELSYNIKLIG